MADRKAFFSIDALMSVLPVILMVVFVFQIYANTANQVSKSAANQQLFDKLVSIGDAVVHDPANLYTNQTKAKNLQANWLNQNAPLDAKKTQFSQVANIPNLYLALAYPGPNDKYDICIYRLVVVGDQQEIKKLFICGDYANH
ncbi:hypothetical protein HY988_05385 [Candidatus Micrarchaeota archaeon]|nr:hypothetical protein [Candidatus Micrarchaeota archaeon]